MCYTGGREVNTEHRAKAINWYNLYNIYNIYNIYNLYNNKHTNKHTNRYYDIYNIYGKREKEEEAVIFAETFY